MTLTGAVLLRTLVPPDRRRSGAPRLHAGQRRPGRRPAGGDTPHSAPVGRAGPGHRPGPGLDGRRPGHPGVASDTDPGWSLGDAGRPSLRLLLLADRVIAGCSPRSPPAWCGCCPTTDPPAQIGVAVLLLARDRRVRDRTRRTGLLAAAGLAAGRRRPGRRRPRRNAGCRRPARLAIRLRTGRRSFRSAGVVMSILSGSAGTR